MSPKKECRAVYGLEHFLPEYYVTYTVESQNDINTRLRMQLMAETDGDPIHIINGSQVCKKNADYERVIRENAFKAFRAPIVRAIDRGGDKAKQLNKLYTRVYGREHPLRKFLDNHYDSITVIYGWAPSTIEHYWSTLTNQLIPHGFH